MKKLDNKILPIAKSLSKVTVLIPCFNEEKTVANVLDVVTKSPLVDEVIVVDDGSTDNSEKVIKKYKTAKLISLPLNLGKGGAIRKGLKQVKTPITFLCDADLSGLTDEHLRRVIEPVKNGGVQICVGVRFKGGIIIQWLRRNLLPLIAGERAIRTSLLREITSCSLANNFGFEPYMNFVCFIHGIKIKKVDLKGIKDVWKIKKRGTRYFLEKLFLDFGKIYFILFFLRLKQIFKFKKKNS